MISKAFKLELSKTLTTDTEQFKLLGVKKDPSQQYLDVPFRYKTVLVHKAK